MYGCREVSDNVYSHPNSTPLCKSEFPLQYVRIRNMSDDNCACYLWSKKCMLASEQQACRNKARGLTWQHHIQDI